MQTLDCSSLENSNEDFNQLSSIVGTVQDFLNTFKRNREQMRVYSFEIPQELITSLENLNGLFAALAQEATLTDAQKKLFTTCELALARSYCWIRYCMDLYIERCKVEPTIEESQQARRMTYEFYFHATYELRNPYLILKGHSQASILDSESDNWKDFLNQVYSSPLIPEHQDEVEQINYWIEELGKFIDDLPRLRDETEGAV